MERVQTYLHQLLQTSRYGGNIVLRDETTLIIFDTPAWGDRESRALRAKFPECEALVHAFDGSLSGFMVVITRRSEPWGFVWDAAFVLTSCAALYTTYWLCSYLRTSVTQDAPI